MRVLRFVSLPLGVISLVLLPHIARAQNPVTWSINPNASGSLKAGDKFTAQVSAQIQGGWHLYSITQGAGGPIPTRIRVPDGQAFKLAGDITGPRPRVEMDLNFQIETETHEGNAVFRVPLVVVADAPAGAQTLNITVRYQTCNDKLCLPPRTVKLSESIMLANAVAGAVAPKPSPTPTLEKAKSTPTPKAAVVTTANSNSGATVQPLMSPEAAPVTSLEPAVPAKSAPSVASGQIVFGTLSRENSFWSFIWLAMTFGALSLLTPCVFPMVPITVSYFTNHASGHRAGAVRDALVYALGIILTFTLLGVSLSIIFGAAGINKFAASPWINLAITAIFLSFAMSLFGAYDLGLPSSVLTRLDSISRGRESSKIIGLLLMGLTFSLTSFTCTAPFVGTLLVMASQGEWIYPVIGMLAFSSVFALPFFVLALAPQLVSHLPRSGGWLNSVKVVMGLLEIAAAMKFLSNVDLVWHWGIFTREVILASWVAITLLITLYLLGKFQLTHDSSVTRIGAVRLMIALGSLALSFYLLTGLFGRRLGELESFLPPALDGPTYITEAGRTSTTFTSNGELTWVTNDYQSGLRQAKAEQKPVFIDFTGYTCTNCRWMEANMFTKTPVKEELAKYVRVRLYTDGEGQPYEQFQQMQQEKFGTVALPLYAVVNSDGNTLTTFPGLTRDQAEFVEFLRNGQARFAPNNVSMNREVTQP